MRRLFLLVSMFLGLLIFAPISAKADVGCPSWTSRLDLSDGSWLCLNPDGSPDSMGDGWALLAIQFYLSFGWSPSPGELAIFWYEY